MLRYALALLVMASPAMAAPGVSVSVDHHHAGRARIRVTNPGLKRGHYTLQAVDKDGQQLQLTASPSSFYLGRNRTRKVRISNLLPSTAYLCATTTASSSLSLQSCASVDQR